MFVAAIRLFLASFDLPSVLNVYRLDKSCGNSGYFWPYLFPTAFLQNIPFFFFFLFLATVGMQCYVWLYKHHDTWILLSHTTVYSLASVLSPISLVELGTLWAWQIHTKQLAWHCSCCLTSPGWLGHIAKGGVEASETHCPAVDQKHVNNTVLFAL